MIKNTNLKIIKLAGTKKGLILLSHLHVPYGENSNPVISIGISLKGDIENPDWKAHIPYENLGDLINALQELKVANDS